MSLSQRFAYCCVCLSIWIPFVLHCTPAPRCSNGISQTQSNPNGFRCTEDCDCNNQHFLGRCVEGSCRSEAREPCFRKQEKRYCNLTPDQQPTDKRCEWGVQTCQDNGLDVLNWGDCKPQSPADAESTKELCTDSIDNDCNRRADFHADIRCKDFCRPGSTEPCYDWKKDEKQRSLFPGFFACVRGIRQCTDDFVWGPCEGAIYPQNKEICDGIDNNCDGQIDEGLPDCKTARACQEGQTEPCYGYARGCTKRETTLECLGICKAGVRTCQAGGAWSECKGQEGPNFEDCNGIDDNCDGSVDEGCICSPGATQPCFVGSKDARGKGECKDGIQTCIRGVWSSCEGNILPQTEICGNNKDDDCNGQIDDNCGLCTNGSVQGCYTGPIDTRYQGECRDGIQVCQNKSWGPCIVQTLPQSEICGNSKDDDCNGQIDDNCGESTTDGGPSEHSSPDAPPSDLPALPDGPCQNGTIYPCPLGGVGVCGQGATTCRQNVWGPCIQTHPRLVNELCDGLDNNCDGQIDEGCPAPCLPNRFVYATPLSHTSFVLAVAFSPDGKILASASYDHTIRLVDVATGNTQHTLTGHIGAVTSVAFSSDGKTLISGSADFSLRYWDTATGTLRATLTGRHTSGVSSVSISPDGNTLASASNDGTIQLMEAATGKILYTLKKHTTFVNSVAFSPDSKLLASGAADGEVMLWDVSNGTHLHTFSGLSTVTSVAFSPDGKFLASGTGAEIKLWDPIQRNLLQTLTGINSYPAALVFSLDSKLLLAGVFNTAQAGSIEIWDLTAFTVSPPLLARKLFINSVAISPNGKTIASGSSDKTVIFWDLPTRKQLPTLSGHTDAVNQVAFSVDARYLASASNDTTAKIRETSTGKVTASLSHNEKVIGLVYTPDGKSLVTVTVLGKAYIWDLATGQESLLAANPNNVSAVALSANGNILACVVAGTVYLWEMATGSQLRAISESSSINAVAFSPNNATLALALGDGTLILRDANTGNLLHTLTKHTSATLSVAFSPDGKTLASGGSDSYAMLWDVATGTHLKTLSGHTDPVRSVAFSVDGKTLATASHDFSIKLWDVSTAKLHLTLPIKHTNSINSLAFSPDGKTLASGSDDTTVMLWECPCKAGATRPCYPGLMGCQRQTTGAFACTAPCKAGLQTCSPLELWGPCVSSILPQPEISSNGKDDDCDGKIDG